jgi:CubicO group peptidase (beta-lactamase class C family)
MNRFRRIRSSILASSLTQIDTWPAPCVGVTLMRGNETIASHGKVDDILPVASVTKVLVALACWIGSEEGTFNLDEPLPRSSVEQPDGLTARHLLSHASGLAPDEHRWIAPPETKRIYANSGFDWLGAVFAERVGLDLSSYVAEAVSGPLGMTSTELQGSPAAGAVSSVRDLGALVGELLRPSLISRATLDASSAVHYPGLGGVLPGFGSQQSNDWGLGVEIRGAKSPHWSSHRWSPRSFGHFGRSGSFVIVDPDADLGVACLTGRDFGPWAVAAWPTLLDDIHRIVTEEAP